VNDLIPHADEFAALETRILDRTVASDRRRRRGLVAGTASIVAAAVGVATGWAVLAPPQAQVDVTYCYETSDLQSQRAEIVAPPETDHGSDAAALALDQCAAAWDIGTFSESPPVSGSVPDLTACVLPNGLVGVFPGRGDKVCDDLGLGVAS
jgi:hypothetical protein